MKQGGRLTLAAGAQKVQSLHFPGVEIRSGGVNPIGRSALWCATPRDLYRPPDGGLCMGSDPKSVVNNQLQHHRISNLFVVDGSVFPRL